MKRSFRYSANTYSALQNNAAYQFSASHALSIYSVRTIYSFIPKNACSTMRLSIAFENGCIDDASDFNWIHQNNRTFAATLHELASAKYTFVILRCPYGRLASTYLDKMVRREADYWYLLRHKNAGIDGSPLTFRKFAESVCTDAIKRSNVHWRPQTDFLVYKRYDKWFQFERLPEAFETLRNDLGIIVHDARPFTRHGQDNFENAEGERYSDTPVDEILQMNQEGKSPAKTALFDRQLKDMVGRAFKRDIELYVSLFGGQDLLFGTQHPI